MHCIVVPAIQPEDILAQRAAVCTDTQCYEGWDDLIGVLHAPGKQHHHLLELACLVLLAIPIGLLAVRRKWVHGLF